MRSAVSTQTTNGPGRPSGHQVRERMARAFGTVSYEVLPFEGAEEQVLAHVPRDVSLTVATTEAKGRGPTNDLAVRLAEQGHDVAPHPAGRPPAWSGTASSRPTCLSG